MSIPLLTLLLLGTPSAADPGLRPGLASARSGPPRSLPRPARIDGEDETERPFFEAILDDDTDDATASGRRAEAMVSCLRPSHGPVAVHLPRAAETVKTSRPLIYTLCTLLI